MTRACDPTCAAARHGTAVAYRHHGCRCPEAKEANRIYKKRLREGRAVSRIVPALGAARRIRALYAIGWRAVDIAEHSGMYGRCVQRLSLAEERDHRRTITRDTHARIVAAYERLSGTDGPSAVTRERARRKGWARPIDWDDDAMDDPAATPHTDPAPARAPAVAKYLGDLIAGLKVDEIAQRHGVQVDSVEQALRRHRERAAS